MSTDKRIRERIELSTAGTDGFLDLQEFELSQIPSELIECASWLRRLDLSWNDIEELDTDILAELRNLETLDLSRNKLTSFPSELSHHSIQYLYLDGNGIRTLKVGRADIPSLRHLSMQVNGLERVDVDISRLVDLEILDLSGNMLINLPEEIGNLRYLRELLLAQNPGLIPPASIMQLSGLRLLDLSENHLTYLPSELGRLPDNIALRLAGNFFESQGLEALLIEEPRTVLRYLRSLQLSEPNDEAKLLLVGEGNVGKTSLVEALCGQPFIEGRETTHGIEIKTVTVSNPNPNNVPVLRLRTWDFGGQEVYRITHQFFFSSRSVYFVVWRPREGKDENAVEAWINRIRLRVGHEARVVVVATHGDERRAELDHETLSQKFGSMLAGFSVIDSKSGNGIGQIQEVLGTIAGALPQIGEPINIQWNKVRDALLSREDPYIRRSTFDRICAIHNVQEEDADALARLLADLGYVVYFPDDDGLRDVMVLQPELLTKAISYVLEDSVTRDAGGVIDHGRLGEIWSNNRPHLPTSMHRYMLRLMEKFDVSYRIPDTDRSLVGQLVPYERPVFDWVSYSDDQSTLEVECEFSNTIYRMEQSSVGDLPGLIAWLIVRNHRFATGMHWRNGVLLRHPEYGTEGLYELLSPTVLRLRVRGEARGFFFDVLRDTLTYLLDTRWPGLTYHLYVPCPSMINGVTGRCRGRFPLRSLERLRERGDESVTCLECLEPGNLNALLTGFRTREQYSVGNLLHTEISALRKSVEETLLSSRAILRTLASEVNDCPRLFAIFPHGEHRVNPRKTFTQQFRLTLWCEEPGAEHPMEPYYKFRKPRQWFADAAPYLQIAARTIALLAPGLGNASAVFSGEATDAKRISDFMKSLADLSGEVEQGNPQPGEYGLTRSEGAALRRLRELLLELDPTRSFAGLRRVLAPTGDYLWVCPAHHGTYEPGLPIFPSSSPQRSIG